ncbi:MAG: hypothetical protein AAFR31_18940 [Cyanobacteria bacterium J06627_8]
MTPYQVALANQDRFNQSDAARCEWASQGFTDGVFGELPQYSNDAYLAGYVRGVKSMPLNHDGTISWPKPMAAVVEYEEF